MMWASVTPNFNFDWLRYLVRRNSGELYSAKGLFLDFLGNRGSLEEECKGKGRRDEKQSDHFPVEIHKSVSLDLVYGSSQGSA